MIALLKDSVFIFGAVQVFSSIIVIIVILVYNSSAHEEGCTAPLSMWLALFSSHMILSGFIKIGIVAHG